MLTLQKYMIIILAVFSIPSFFVQTADTSSETKVVNLLKKASELKYSDWKTAKKYIDQAEKISEKSEDQSVKARFKFEAANIYYDQDLFDISLKYTFDAYRYYQNRDPSKAAEAENLLAIIYGRMNNQEEALKYFRSYYNHIRNNKDLSAKALNNIGTLYLSMNKTDSAFYYFDRALLLLKTSKNRSLLLTTTTNLARTLAKVGKVEEAEKEFLNAEALLKGEKNPAISGLVYQEMAQFYLDSHQPQLAVKYGEQAKKYASVKYSFQNSSVLKVLYQSYLAAGNPQKSAEYFQQYDRIRDSLNIEEKAVNIEKEKIQASFKDKEKEMELMNSQKRLQFGVVVLLLLLVSSILLFFLLRYRNNLEKEKLENELSLSRENELKLDLELRNKELVSKSILESEQTNLYQNVVQQLKEINNLGNADDLRKELNAVIFKLSRNPGKSSWDEFNLRFNNVYDSFYDKLQEIHPNLNHNDKRLCAFIKLNLSSKEIADLTKTSVKSVENSRTRLRKKLNLTNTKIELNQYLSDL